MAIGWGAASALYFKRDNVEHFVLPGTNFYDDPELPVSHFVRYPESDWQLQALGPTMATPRDSDFLNSDKDFVIVDHGQEYPDREWPHGHVSVGRVLEHDIDWQQVSINRSFHHSVSTGDINGDGLEDIVPVAMGTKGDWWCDAVHAWVQTPAGTFEEDRCKLGEPENFIGAGTVKLEDLDSDGLDEVIVAGYVSWDGQGEAYNRGLLVYRRESGNAASSVVFESGNQGLYSDHQSGATSLYSTDYNSDGQNDLVIAYEGLAGTGIEIWQRTGLYSFAPDERFHYSHGELYFREIQVLDVDEPGDDDIVFNMPGESEMTVDRDLVADEGDQFVLLSNLVLLNDDGEFVSPEIERRARIPFGTEWLISVKEPGEPLTFIGTGTYWWESLQDYFIIEIEYDLRP